MSRLLGWMLAGDAPFPEPDSKAPHWYRRKHPAVGLLIRTPWWLAGTAVFVLALAYLGVPAILEVLQWISSARVLEEAGVAASIDRVSAAFTTLSLGERAFGVLLAAAGVVTLAGIARRVLER